MGETRESAKGIIHNWVLRRVVGGGERERGRMNGNLTAGGESIKKKRNQ